MIIETIRKATVFVSAIVCAAILTSSHADAEIRKASDIRIIFVTHGEASDTYWSVVKNGMLEAQKTMGSVVEYFAPEVWDIVKMGDLMDTAIASKPDGMVVTIPDAQAIGSKVKKAADAGIPVIVIDTGEDQVAATGSRFYIGPGSYKESGRQAAQHLRSEGATYGVCIKHEVGNAGNNESCVGIKSAFQAPMWQHQETIVSTRIGTTPTIEPKAPAIAGAVR